MQIWAAGKRIFLVFVALVVPLLAHAQNDCKAVVAPTPNGVTTAGPIVTIKFDVKTECEASSGQFTYTYRTSQSPNKDIERNSTNWTAANGKAFQVKEEFMPGSGVTVKDVKVRPNVRSTKIK
jgi:hypothetical protein